ncbi:DUF3829 domain-containing protein [Paenibacillus oleatilyticus]|uniref:DUF3829 domain-containing protein n=1 Tax=Paenibacillus oleatilyticus TaxID=2594886 RepID=UPI001C1FE6F2|nr:DUF3829 domain-containing protein [Paenibacillus oleatilyticus]MBU7316713.1 YiiG family protein [Paenibacillus oleatilyticus]
MNKVQLFLTLILLSALITACGGPRPMAATEPEKERAYWAMKDYIDSHLIEKVLSDYFENLGDGEQPVIPKDFDYKMRSFSTYKGSRTNKTELLDRSLSYVDKKPVFPTVDPIVIRMRPVINELKAALAEAYDYYEMKNYVDDNFAKGKELHARIRQAWAALYPIREEFSAAMRNLGAELRKAHLESYTSDKQDFRYSTLKLVVDAEAMSAELSHQGITADNVLDLDMNAFKPKYDVLVEDLKIVTQQYQVMVDKDSSDKYKYEKYVNAAKEVKAAASEMVERVNKQEKVEKVPSPNDYQYPSGTPEKFSSKVGSVASEYEHIF